MINSFILCVPVMCDMFCREGILIFLVYEALSRSNESVVMDFLASRQILLREFSWIRAY